MYAVGEHRQKVCEEGEATWIVILSTWPFLPKVDSRCGTHANDGKGWPIAF